jgi:hypothetical protein
VTCVSVKYEDELDGQRLRRYRSSRIPKFVGGAVIQKAVCAWSSVKLRLIETPRYRRHMDRSIWLYDRCSLVSTTLRFRSVEWHDDSVLPVGASGYRTADTQAERSCHSRGIIPFSGAKELGDTGYTIFSIANVAIRDRDLSPHPLRRMYGCIY